MVFRHTRELDGQERVPVSDLTERDYQALAIAFGFMEDWRGFRQFAILQQSKSVDRQIDRARNTVRERGMVFGSGRV
jgi:hypothetical protein